MRAHNSNSIIHYQYPYLRPSNHTQARQEPQWGPGKHYRVALSHPYSVCLEIEMPKARREGGNVGRGVNSPSD